MKKVILIIIALGTFVSKGQERDCSNTKIYNLVFQEMQLYKKKAVEIKVGYKPSKFIIESIDKMNIFDTKEMEQFNNLPKDMDYLSCSKFKRQIELILSDDLIKENGSYNSYKFSKVISLSDSKKCILMYTVAKNRKYEGGKAIGGEILYIYDYHKGKWSLSDKKIVVMY
ncbi:hypothetical protein ATE84_1003 [Aquimarina sp. MAR_2010_214]|uniref:hypothetical protein n=1 Tax=Aquimarina sp. MAR_2010_214 TaxID=1250026 RepID=UPI000C707C57|nr:hypothetical protein [Aquimarina sp. MAR_2010_214]PKV48987.1 hypothetical protein ATE84_1003 [Aquimarina sp. MAR_2010_214]